MKLFNIIYGALAMSILALQVQASTESPPSAKTSKQEILPGEYPAQKSIAKLRTFNAKPRNDADFYIFYTGRRFSSSEHVTALIEFVKAYEKMKKDGRVELIFISHNKSKNDARKYIRENKAKFPTIMHDHESVKQLLGYKKPDAYYWLTIIDKNGKVLLSNRSRHIRSWEAYTIDSLDKKNGKGSSSKAKPKEKFLPGEYPTQKSVQKLRTFNGMLNDKADFYIYLDARRVCLSSQEVQDISKMVKLYKDMKADGRVEMIFISHDNSKRTAYKHLKEFNGKFPTIMYANRNIKQLLGYSKGRTGYNAITVDKYGKVISNNHPDNLIKTWKKLTINSLSDDSSSKK